MNIRNMMKYRRLISIPAPALLVISFLLSSPGLARQSDKGLQPITLTLDESIALALKNNRGLLMADQDRSRAEAQIDEARSDALPQVSIAGAYTRNALVPVLFLSPHSPINPGNETMKFVIGSSNSWQAGVQLSQPLFSRKVGTAMDIANDYRDYSEQAYHTTAQSVALTVKEAFYTILLSQQLVAANRQGLEVVKANLENVQSLYRHGSAAEYDLLRAQVQLANTEPLVTSSENSLALAKNALKQMLALPMEQDVRVTGEFTFDEIPEATLDQARAHALANNSSIAQLALQESMMEKNVDIVRAAYFPSLNLVGGYRWLTEDNTFDFKKYNWAQTLNVGLVLSFTVFDGFKTSARAEQALIDRQKVHLARLEAEEGLKIRIQSTELRMTEARKRMQGLEKSIEQAQKAVSIAQTRFKSGVGTQLELLDTQVAMTRAQTTHAQAVYDYNVARAEWEYSVGGAQ